jgi:hydrogenase-4 component E
MLLLAIAVIFVVKVLVAPRFFFGLVKKHQLKFSVSTYLNSPATLIVLALLTGVTYSQLFLPLTILSQNEGKTLLLAVATMFISIFLIINRRGALSQMIGILSLENGIVSFATLAGLEQAPGLQIGIMFDILVWIIIASVFASMLYRQFGSLDVTSMTHLKEE